MFARGKFPLGQITGRMPCFSLQIITTINGDICAEYRWRYRMSRHFLVAFDSVVGSEKYDNFTRAFRQAILSANQDDFFVDQIDYAVSKEQVDEYLTRKKYSVLICFEKLQNTSIGQGTVRVWMKDYPDLKIILVVDNARKSTGKMKGLYDRGYYDAAYFEDFKPMELVQIIQHSRTQEEAWDYYGLDHYIDVLAKDKVRSAAAKDGQDMLDMEAGGNDPETAQMHEEIGHGDNENDRKDLADDISGVLAERPEDYEVTAEDEIDKMDLRELLEENDVSEYMYADEYSSRTYPETVALEQYGDSSDEDVREVIDNYAEMILSYFTKEDIVKLRNLEMNLLSEQEFSTAIWEKVEEYGLSRLEADAVYRKSISHFFGYDVIESLLDDREISDIRIMGPEMIRTKRLGIRETAPIHFRSADHYKSFVAHLASKNNVRIDDSHAIRTFTDTHHDKFFLRVNITTEYISGTGLPYVHIRKTSRTKYTLEELIRADMFDKDMASYLIGKVRGDGGIIFCGQGGSGKSTLTNTLIEHIPHSNSGLIIQENFELFSDTHPEMMEQNLMTDEEMNSGDNSLSYDLKALAINGLLLDLDYYIIGEIKGGEALYFLNAWYTGHRCLTTLHSDTALHALDKLVDYAMYESRYTKGELLRMVSDRATIIYMKGFKVYEVVEAAGWDEKTGNIRYRKIFFRNEGGWIKKNDKVQIDISN